jgi:hypothetical protein
LLLVGCNDCGPLNFCLPGLIINIWKLCRLFKTDQWNPSTCWLKGLLDMMTLTLSGWNYL